MSSLNKKRTAKYFDKVRISSHLDHLSLNQYQFRSKIASCNHEEVVEDGLVKFSALDFCKNLRSLSDLKSFNIEPDFRFSNRYTNFDSLGPVRPNFSVRNFNWSYDDFRLIVQDIICEPESNDQNKWSTYALISAVIRLIPAPMPYRLAVAKTGLSARISVLSVLRISVLSVLNSKNQRAQSGRHFSEKLGNRSSKFNPAGGNPNDIMVVGYILPLITGCEVLPKWKQSKSFTSYQLSQLLTPSKFLEEYLPRFLIFIALLLTANVFQRVSESRKKLPGQRTSTRIKRSPSDKLVLMITSAVHFIGFLVFFIVQSNSLELDNRPDHGFHYSLKETSALQSLTIQLQDYLSLIQDLFLLPHVIGNFLWCSNVKPLSKFYYIGYTSVRMIFRVYDFVKDPIAGAEIKFIGNPDFTTMSARNIAPAATMIILVIIVYIQQNIRHQKTQAS
ncbi:hypothetical protein ACFE04_012033 [Oxalis oulophora]